jgi:Leucine-rich repeat (LRR) protein
LPQTPRQLPEEIAKLSLLRTLNLANNPLARLPLALCHLKAMDTLVLDGTSDTLTFPPPSAVDLGSSTAVLKFLANEAGVEWSAPLAHVLASLEAGGRSDPRASAIDVARRAEEEHLAKLMAVRDYSA